MSASCKNVWKVFASFFRIGAFTFGGGYAMIPLIQKEAVEKNGWVTDEDILDIIAIAESTPGPIAINSATFVGYRAAGVLGSVCATLGVVLPSFLMIYTISMFLEGFLEITVIANAFRGIKIAVGFLILQAGIKLQKQLDKEPLTVALLWVAAGLILAVNIFSWRLSSTVLMVAGAVTGLAVHLCRRAGDKA